MWASFISAHINNAWLAVILSNTSHLNIYMLCVCSDIVKPQLKISHRFRYTFRFNNIRSSKHLMDYLKRPLFFLLVFLFIRPHHNFHTQLEHDFVWYTFTSIPLLILWIRAKQVNWIDIRKQLHTWGAFTCLCVCVWWKIRWHLLHQMQSMLHMRCTICMCLWQPMKNSRILN